MLWRTILFSLTFFDGIPSREQRTIAFAGNHDGVQATVVIQTLSTQINELEESDDTGFKWQKGIEGVANTVLGYSSETHITAPGRVPAKLAGLWDPVPPSRAGDGASQSGGSARSGAVAMLYVPSAQHQISSSPTPGNLKNRESKLRTSDTAREAVLYLPCRQMGQELESSSSHGSTHAWWKTCLPSHGSTRTSSPSSKSTMQIGHVSRPIDSGRGSATDAVVVGRADESESEGPARGLAGGTTSASSESSLESWTWTRPCGRAGSPSTPTSAAIAAWGVSGPAEDDEARTSVGMSFISSIGGDGSFPFASRSSFVCICASASALRDPNLIRGNVSRIARVSTPPRPGPPTSPEPAAAR